MRPHLFFLILFLHSAFTASSQEPSEFRIQKFNTESGLPSNGIKGLQWDEQTGFLWIATEAGIVRYNGMEFKIFNNDDEAHITNERILFMVKNNEGKIYAADNSGNIFYVDKNRLKFFGFQQMNSHLGNDFISISVSDKLYNSEINFKKEIYALQYDCTLPVSDTATFVLHTNNLFYYSATITSPVLALNPPLQIAGAFKYGQDIFLVDLQKEIFLLDKESRNLIKLSSLENNGFSQKDIIEGTIIWENGMTHPILFNKQKAWLLSYRNGNIEAKLICNGIPGGMLIRYAQFDDKRKTLFIGTDSKGFISIEQNRVQPMKVRTSSLNLRTSYYSQVELPNGNILTNEGHIIGDRVTKGQSSPIQERFSMNTLLVGDSLLWYGKPDASLERRSSFLHSYNSHTGITKVYPKIRENYQMVMAFASEHLYLARDSGIYRLQDDSLALLYAYDLDRKSGMDYDMDEISPGILAIASCNSLLLFNIFTNQLDTLFGPGNYCFRSIWKYKDYVFFGTYGGGLFIYKNGKLKPLPLDKNKYLLFSHCFVKDNHGYCWISTNRGLFKASLSDLTDVIDKNSSEVYYYYYGKNDGMDMTELNGGCTPCAILKKDKTISFPTMDGLIWVNPDKAIPILPKGEIYFDNLQVDNRLINPDSIHLENLPPKTGEIIVRLAIPAWSNKENIYVEYKLNDDTSWKLLDIERGMEIRFNNLEPADYKLTIRKRNGFGVNNYTYKQLAFHIVTPWYSKWWFYLILVAMTAAIFRLYFNIRTQQLRSKQWRLQAQVADKTWELQQKNEVLEKNDTIKTRLISIISHDIVTPLKFLTAAGKNLVEKRELMTEELQHETLREMINTSQELQLLSTNILNWIKYQNKNRRLIKEHFNVHELTNQVLGVLNSLAKQKNLKLLNETTIGLNIYQYYEPLKILIYNLVSNAINFTDRGSIVIGNKEVNTETVLYVKDEGVGMSVEQIQNVMSDQFIVSSTNIDNRKGNGLGYLIIKDLLKMMGGSFHIESEKGKGTTVFIKLKEVIEG